MRASHSVCVFHFAYSSMCLCVCVRYIQHISYEPLHTTDQQSNMAILELELPSGYTTDSDSLINLARVHNVKKIETKNANTAYIVYFDSLELNRMVCPVFDAFQAHQVENPKPASISIYDYYDNGKEFLTDN